MPYRITGRQRLRDRYRQRIASILHPIFESQGAWGELSKVLEVELEDLTEPASRAAHLSRIGELSETNRARLPRAVPRE